MNVSFDWAAAHVAARAPKPRQCHKFPVELKWNRAKHKFDKKPMEAGFLQPGFAPDPEKMRNAKNWGVTIPAGVVGLDLDLYKDGCSREAVEAYLGCALDWDVALLQTTAQGGHHYIFALPDGVTIEQGSEIAGVPGFDLRTTGKGWLCTGNKYTVREDIGDALSAVQTAPWPILPAAAIEKLRKPDRVQVSMQTRAANDGGLPADVPDALSHVDPDARDVWLQVGMALHSTGDADAWDTWCNWSKRSAKFDADEQRKAWVSFHDKRDGVTLGTIYKLAKDAGWVRPERDKRDLSRTTRTASPEYRLLTGGEVQSMPALAWRIKGVLPARGLAQIYGPPGSGKSFLAFDMAAAIAGGRDWFGYRVTAAPVVYVALEGEAGFPQRTQAWCRSREQPLPDDMRLILQPLRITDGGDVAAMGKAITDAGLSGAVVIVDTQNQAAPDADENSSESMGRILAGGKRLAGLVEGVVVLVAHAGKDEARGVRGHSSQRAAMDASIKVSRNEDAREWCVDKAKDGADGAKHGFTLEAVKLGEDADGDPLTSCVVVRDDTLRARRKPSAGEAAGLKAYVVACERGQCRVDDFGGFAGLHLEDWRAVFYELSTADNAETKCRSFHRTRRDLAGHGHMSALHDVYLPTDQKILERGQEFANLRSQRHKGQNAQPDNPDKSGQVRLVRPDTKPDGQDNPL